MHSCKRTSSTVPSSELCTPWRSVRCSISPCVGRRDATRDHRRSRRAACGIGGGLRHTLDCECDKRLRCRPQHHYLDLGHPGIRCDLPRHRQSLEVELGTEGDRFGRYRSVRRHRYRRDQLQLRPRSHSRGPGGYFHREAHRTAEAGSDPDSARQGSAVGHLGGAERPASQRDHRHRYHPEHALRFPLPPRRPLPAARCAGEKPPSPTARDHAHGAARQPGPGLSEMDSR